MKNEEFNYEIVEQIAVLSTSGSWSVELNKVSWGGRAPTYDLRRWNADHSRAGKGITLSVAELAALATAIGPSAM